MMDDGYISELVKKFKESISQEESELVDRFKEYLQIAIMSIKNNESKFINKDDESIRSVVTKMANDLIYASLETKKRVLIEEKNLIRINEYSNQAYKDATKIVMGDSEAIEYDIDPKKAVQTRLKQFAGYAKNGDTIAAPHLPFPGIGHIYSADGKSYQWLPISFKD